MKFVKKIFIAQHPNEVRNFLLNGTHEHLFNSWSVGEIKQIDSNRYQGQFRFFGQITHHIEPSGPSILYMSESLPKQLEKREMNFEVKPVTGGSQVTLIGEVVFKSPFYKFIDPIFGLLYSRHLWDILKDLKRELEHSSY